jgi:hypothetical protein
MGKLNILPRKKFEIVLDNGTVITGQYGTWAGIRFSQKRGIKLSQMADYLNTSVTAEDYEVIADYILSAVEQPFMEKGGSNFPYNAANFFSWMDEIGWDNLGKILNPDQEEEKKSQAEGSPSSGTTLSESQEVAA